MPLFLLANWKWLLGAAAALVLTAMLGFAEIKISTLKTALAQVELDIQKQKTSAQEQIAASEKHAREIADQNAALNIQLEKDHAATQQQIDHDATDNRKLAARIGELLHAQSRCGSGGPNHVPGKSDAPSSGPSDAASSRLPDAVSRFVDGTTELVVEADGVADVGIRCHGFAIGAK